MTKTSGVFGEDDEDGFSDNATVIRFTRPVRIKPNTLYAIKFSLDGGKTYCGEGLNYFLLFFCPFLFVFDLTFFYFSRSGNSSSF